MGGLRCPRCGRHHVRRAHRAGALERLLSAFAVYPFRCQVCGRRFRAVQVGRRQTLQTPERRDWDRHVLHRPATLMIRDGERADGEVVELSVAGCTVTTAARVPEGASVRAELGLVAGAPPIVVEAATVRSVGAGRVGLAFARLEPRELERLREVVAALLAGRPDPHEAPPPREPRWTDRLRALRSADFWFLLAILLLFALAFVQFFPLVRICPAGRTC